jgi:signal transduction histidine kinase
MRARVLRAILAVTAIAIVLFAVPLVVVVERFVGQNATLRLERQAILATRDVPSDYEQSADPVELPLGRDGAKLALYNTSGRLVAGVGPASADSTTRHALDNVTTDRRTAGTRVVAVPIAANEQVIGAIRAEQSTAATNGRAWRIAGLLGLLALGVLCVGAVIASIVARRLARPVRRLSDAAVRLGAGDFTIALPASRISELDDASRALVSTAHRLDELLRHERAFTADASHQLRTPLAGLRAAIETELVIPRSDPTVILNEALFDIERLERTITDLLAIARSPSSPQGMVHLSSVLDDVRTVWHGRFAAAGRPLTIHDRVDVPPVQGRAAMIAQAIDVLLDNALLHGSGEVRIEQHASGATVTLSISDEGPGFPDSYPTPPARDANSGNDLHGLGLPMARRLIESMPGRLVIARSGPQPRIDIVLSRADPETKSESQTS